MQCNLQQQRLLVEVDGQQDAVFNNSSSENKSSDGSALLLYQDQQSVSRSAAQPDLLLPPSLSVNKNNTTTSSTTSTIANELAPMYRKPTTSSSDDRSSNSSSHNMTIMKAVRLQQGGGGGGGEGTKDEYYAEKNGLGNDKMMVVGSNNFYVDVDEDDDDESSRGGGMGSGHASSTSTAYPIPSGLLSRPPRPQRSHLTTLSGGHHQQAALKGQHGATTPAARSSRTAASYGKSRDMDFDDDDDDEEEEDEGCYVGLPDPNNGYMVDDDDDDDDDGGSVSSIETEDGGDDSTSTGVIAIGIVADDDDRRHTHHQSGPLLDQTTSFNKPSSSHSSAGTGTFLGVGGTALPSNGVGGGSRPYLKPPPQATAAAAAAAVVTPPPPKTEEEANQQALSFVAAQNAAEEEHNNSKKGDGKSKVRISPSLASASAFVTRRTSARRTSSSSAATTTTSSSARMVSSSADDGLDQGMRDAKRSAAAGGIALAAGGAQRFRRNGGSGSASSSLSSSPSVTTAATTRGPAARHADERARKEQLKASNPFDPCASAAIGPALAPGMSDVYLATGFETLREEDDQGQPGEGPLLASGVGCGVVLNNDDGLGHATMPGAFASTGPRNSKEVAKEVGYGSDDAGPSLAPPTQQQQQSVGAGIAVGVDSSDNNNNTVDDRDTMEVDTGIHVGAFAIAGVESGHLHPTYDSDLEDEYDNGGGDGCLPALEQAEVSPSVEILDAHLAGEGGAPEALDAELQVVVDGVLSADVDELDDDFFTSPKAQKRLRIIQVTVLIFAFMAIALIFGAVFGIKSVVPDAIQPEWLPASPELYGPPEEPQTMFGSAVAISGDGNRLAVAAPGSDLDRQRNVGQVRIFDGMPGSSNGTDWKLTGTVVGSDMNKEALASIALSGDGRRLVVGRPMLASGGTVEIYEETKNDDGQESSWKSTASLSLPASDGGEGKDVSSWFGYSVSLTQDGKTLAVGAPQYTSQSSGMERSGLVRLYRYSEGSTSGWSQIGSDFVGQGEGEFLGWSVALVSLQEAGSVRVAAGGPATQKERGLVRVVDWTGSKWQPVTDGGDDSDALTGDRPLGRFGESVALSKSGTVLAVGASGTAFEYGSVKVYRLKDITAESSTGAQWVADSTKNLVGKEPAEGFGSSIALSSDGSVLAVGSPGGGTPDSGLVQMLEYNATDVGSTRDDPTVNFWHEVGPAIGNSSFYQPLNVGGALGTAVALSSDGHRVLVGAPSTTFDGTIAEAGMARVYDRFVEAKSVDE